MLNLLNLFGLPYYWCRGRWKAMSDCLAAMRKGAWQICLRPLSISSVLAAISILNMIFFRHFAAVPRRNLSGFKWSKLAHIFNLVCTRQMQTITWLNFNDVSVSCRKNRLVFESELQARHRGADDAMEVRRHVLFTRLVCSLQLASPCHCLLCWLASLPLLWMELPIFSGATKKRLLFRLNFLHGRSRTETQKLYFSVAQNCFLVSTVFHQLLLLWRNEKILCSKSTATLAIFQVHHTKIDYRE